MEQAYEGLSYVSIMLSFKRLTGDVASILGYLEDHVKAYVEATAK